MVRDKISFKLEIDGGSINGVLELNLGHSASRFESESVERGEKLRDKEKESEKKEKPINEKKEIVLEKVIFNILSLKKFKFLTNRKLSWKNVIVSLNLYEIIFLNI